jgi:hypothetical protein
MFLILEGRPFWEAGILTKLVRDSLSRSLWTFIWTSRILGVPGLSRFDADVSLALSRQRLGISVIVGSSPQRANRTPFKLPINVPKAS